MKARFIPVERKSVRVKDSVCSTKRGYVGILLGKNENSEFFHVEFDEPLNINGVSILYYTKDQLEGI
jgi:hypothetical protein